MGNDLDPGAVAALHMLLMGKDTRLIVHIAGNHSKSAVFKEVVVHIPLLKAKEHISTQSEDKLILRVAFAEPCHSVGGVALSGAADLHIGNDGVFQRGKIERAKLQPFLRLRAARLQLLVGGLIVGDDEQHIRRKLLGNAASGLKMAQMGRVEAAAVYGYSHYFFLSFTRTILGSLSLRLYKTNLVPMTWTCSALHSSDS